MPDGERWRKEKNKDTAAAEIKKEYFLRSNL
jgi:hypothetical protein